MAGTGRIYRRGLIYYIAYRWEGREYRESARSSERGVWRVAFLYVGWTLDFIHPA